MADISIIQNCAFWDMKPCCPSDRYWFFPTYCLHLTRRKQATWTKKIKKYTDTHHGWHKE